MSIPPPTLAIVIVTWNVRTLAVEAVRAALDDLKRAPFEGVVWVVDNDSRDGTPQAIRAEFPQVHLLEPGENLGFAAGNNAALRAIGFPQGNPASLPAYVLLLNPDTLVQPGALAAMLAGMQATGAGLAGARLVYGDGSFQHSAFRFPDVVQVIMDLYPVPARLLESRLNGRYPRHLYQSEAPFWIDFPLGASFLLRREVIQQTGLFDERFHLYCEEIDWAIRIHEAGWRAVCVPTAEIVHYGGQSTGQVRPQSVINLWSARLLLYRKHYSTLTNAVVRAIIRAGMNRAIRMLARDSSVDDDTRQALVAAYREVIQRTRSPDF